MGRAVIPQTPGALPSNNEIAAGKRRAKRNGFPDSDFVIAGSRVPAADRNKEKNKRPDFATHGTPRWVNAGSGDFGGKHLIIFLHGYNVTPGEAVESAAEFFGRLKDALVKDGRDPDACSFLLFTWPGDVGTVYFNDAQRYAHHSGVALFELLKQVDAAARPASISIAAHSLGAHVALRCASVLGIRRVDEKVKLRINRVLLMGAAVEDDVFERILAGTVEYHFPEAAFGVERLHFTCSRSDEVLAGAFRVNEFDRALGFAGPPTMEPLQSLARRHKELFPEEREFTFRLHDLSPNSSTMMNPDLSVDSHGDYWKMPVQMDYYVNYLR